VSAAEAEQLSSIARSRSLPHSLVRRAQIVLMSAEGTPNQVIAERCGGQCSDDQTLATLLA